MVERVADGAVDLRHAAQRVRILDLVGQSLVARLERRVAEQVAELRGDRDLAGMRPGQLVGRRERDVRPEQRLDAHRRRDAGRPDEPVGVGEQERPDRAHQLGPVEEREALLGLEDERLEADLAQGDERRHVLAADLDPAAADERQGEVGERRQVAGRADRALLRHDGWSPRSRKASRRSTISGRQPLWPSASVFARSRSIARTTSRGSGAPTPAAWLIRRFSWRRAASAGGTNRVASAPKPVVTP